MNTQVCTFKQFSVISAKIVSFFQFLRHCLANYECSWPQITFTEQLFVYSLPDRICMVIQIMSYLILPRTNIMSIGVRFYKSCGIRYQCLTWQGFWTWTWRGWWICSVCCSCSPQLVLGAPIHAVSAPAPLVLCNT